MDDMESKRDTLEEFDPYYHWLGIPPFQRPITLYRLLGLRDGEHNMDVIANAADRQMAFVRQHASGPKGKTATKLLNEISQARVTLLDPKKKAEYDAQFRRKEPTILHRPPLPGRSTSQSTAHTPPGFTKNTPMTIRNISEPVEGVNIPPRTIPGITSYFVDSKPIAGTSHTGTEQSSGNDESKVAPPAAPPFAGFATNVKPPPPPPTFQTNSGFASAPAIEPGRPSPDEESLASSVSRTTTCPRCRSRITIESHKDQQRVHCPECHLTIDQIQSSPSESTSNNFGETLRLFLDRTVGTSRWPAERNRKWIIIAIVTVVLTLMAISKIIF